MKMESQFNLPGTNGELIDGKFWRYKATQYDPNYGGWNPLADGNSPDNSINQDLAYNRMLMNEAYANHPIAAAIVNNFVSSVVGKGFNFSSHIGNHKVDAIIEKHINRFFNSTECDASDRFSLSGLLTKGTTEWANSGELMGAFVKSNNQNPNGYTTKLRLFDTDTIQSDPKIPKMVHGIKFDTDGVPQFMTQNNNGKFIKYDFYDKATGEKTAFQAMRGRYIVQHHGVPLLTTAYKLLMDMSTLQNALVRRDVNASSVGLIMKTPMAGDIEKGLPKGPLGSDIAGKAATTGNAKPILRPIIPVSPGAMIPLSPGEDIEQIKMDEGTTNYKEKMEYNTSVICSSISMSFEYLFKRYSDSNYSSARRSVIDSQIEVQAYQQILVLQIIKPLLKKFIAELQSKNIIPTKISANDIVEDHIHIIYPKPDILDLNKEIGAYCQAIDHNLCSHQEAAMELGFNSWEKTFAQLGKEKIEAKLNGLDQDSPAKPKQDVGHPPGDDSTKA